MSKTKALNLKRSLGELHISYAALARHLGLSKATVHAICNLGKFPTGFGGPDAIREKIRSFLVDQGADPVMLAELFKREGTAPRAKAKPVGSPINLKADLPRYDVSQAELARHMECGVASISKLCNTGLIPGRFGGQAHFRKRVCAFLVARGANPTTVHTTFEPMSAQAKAELEEAAADAESDFSPTPNPTEDYAMLLRKHTLTRETRDYFKIPRDPFPDQVGSEEEVFLNDDIRHVRAAMRQTAKHGGMLAVVGQSGAGKSTLVLDLQEWILTSGEPITLIVPYVLGMGRSDRKTRPLVADDIIRTIFKFLAPTAQVPLNNVRRASRMHELLAESAKVGRRHVLLIEEAHDLATQTLKHLKRFYELQSGFRKLLSIILVGQTELEDKLSEHNPDVREVVQRCEMVKLPAVDNHIEGYLRHKLKAVDVSYDALFEADAIDEIRNRLRHAVVEGKPGARHHTVKSLCHPLAIQNLVSAALNEAVTIGASKVNGALIAAAARS